MIKAARLLNFKQTLTDSIVEGNFDEEEAECGEMRENRMDMC